jgi:hypothetical protein
VENLLKNKDMTNMPPQPVPEGAEPVSTTGEGLPVAEKTITEQDTATKPPNENKMEVHHHSHSHGRRDWKSYVGEFLMLFLAVFCGFFAEYQLEHKIEKEKGRQFLRSYYDDLITDTGRISFYINFDDEKLVALAKLSVCYRQLSSGNEQQPVCLLDVMKNSATNRPFKITERTISQLSNAGFRLLKKVDADSIIAFQKAVDNFQDFQSTMFQEAQNNVRTTFNLLVNFNAHVQMSNPPGIDTPPTPNDEEVTTPLLFTRDKALLNRYFNELQLYYRVIYNHRRLLLDLKRNQVRLIEYFQTKYHFE